MPWKFKDLDKEKILEVTVEGVLGIEELKRITLDSMDNLTRTKFKKSLADYSNARFKVGLFDLLELPKLYDENKTKRTGYKTAIVISDKIYFDEAAHFFENITANRGYYGFKVFRTYKDAFNWLTEK
jgi:hypothetical protein